MNCDEKWEAPLSLRAACPPKPLHALASFPPWQLQAGSPWESSCSSWKKVALGLLPRDVKRNISGEMSGEVGEQAFAPGTLLPHRETEDSGIRSELEWAQCMAQRRHPLLPELSLAPSARELYRHGRAVLTLNSPPHPRQHTLVSLSSD